MDWARWGMHLAPRILIIGDETESLDVVSRALLDHGCEVISVSDPHTVVNSSLLDPPHLYIIDVDLSGMDGFMLCDMIKQTPKLREIPIIFACNGAHHDVPNRCSAHGAADYVLKPIDISELIMRVETQLKLQALQKQLSRGEVVFKEQVDEQISSLKKSHVAIAAGLSKLAEYRDVTTGLHLNRVPQYCTVIAEELRKYPERSAEITDDWIYQLAYSSTMHDIGKVAIQDGILLKAGALTPSEFEVMKAHVIIGAQALGEIQALYEDGDFLNMAMMIVRHHHEAWNGTGYPDGLAGEQIPLAARIVAVADVYDSLRSRRPYKDGVSHQEACTLIQAYADTKFDAQLVLAFMAVSEEIGSIYDRYADLDLWTD